MNKKEELKRIEELIHDLEEQCKNMGIDVTRAVIGPFFRILMGIFQHLVACYSSLSPALFKKPC
jgi:hypothetical protein